MQQEITRINQEQKIGQKVGLKVNLKASKCILSDHTFHRLCNNDVKAYERWKLAN